MIVDLAQRRAVHNVVVGDDIRASRLFIERIDHARACGMGRRSDRVHAHDRAKRFVRRRRSVADRRKKFGKRTRKFPRLHGLQIALVPIFLLRRSAFAVRKPIIQRSLVSVIDRNVERRVAVGRAGKKAARGKRAQREDKAYNRRQKNRNFLFHNVPA